MNNDTFLLMLSVYSAPVLSGVLSAAFLHLAGNRKQGSMDVELRKPLTAYFLTVAVNWTFAMSLLFAPAVVAGLNGLVYSLLLLVQVFLYHYLYILTADTGEKPFTFRHYILPVIIFVGLSLWAAQVPPEAHMASIAVPTQSGDSGLYTPNLPLNDPSFAWYNAAVRSKPLVRMLYSLIYSILAVRRILRYRRRIVNFSADTENTSLGWLLFTVALAFPLFLTPVIVALASPYKALVTFLGAFPAIILFIQLPVLCYYTLTHRYVLMTQADATVTDSGTEITVGKIERQQLEEFMNSSKPYLKADLKITGLAESLHTNRNHLSSFINTTYGMNFSQFINGYRLRELDALRADGKYIRLGNLELIHKAGFGSYHAYYRVKKQQDKLETLPPDE